MTKQDTVVLNTGVQPRRIAKKSVLSGQENVMTIECSIEQLNRWQGGELIQNVFPHLTDVQQEFMISGMSEEEQSGYFKEVL